MLDHDSRIEIRDTDLAEPISHYTDAVRWKDLLFVSGIAPLDSDGVVVGPGEARLQARCVFENMARILTLGGATFQDILKVTVYLTDIDDRVLIDPVRREFFGESRPASTLIEVSRLAVDGMKVEVDAVAAIGHGGDGGD